MQIDRLFGILYILLDKKLVTSKELAEKFEVSTRTVYRDIETLSAAGVPIYMSKGKGGGISLLPDFVLNKTILTNEERSEILSSLNAVRAVSLSDTHSALEKLGGLFGESQTDWIEVEFSSWGNKGEERAVFSHLKSAIIQKRVITFCYESVKGQRTEREAEALKLCFKSGAWYLYAFCKSRQDYRFFKLKRIKELCLTERKFYRKAPDRIFSEESSYKDELVKLKLKLSPRAAYRVYDEFECYDRQEDGSFLAEIEYPKGEWLFYYLLTFGSDCEVLEPEEIRGRLKVELEKAFKKYL